MGVDISSHTGIIASTSEILKLVNGKNKKRVVEICQDFYNDIYSEHEKHKDCSWRKKSVEYFSPLKDIQAKTVGDLKEVLESVIKVSGEPAKYDLDTHVQYGEELCSLWQTIIEEAVDFDLPYLEEVTAFGSPRYNGWDVPLGEACFIFSEHACFEKSLSEIGKNLKKAIGHVSITEWTHYSC